MSRLALAAALLCLAPAEGVAATLKAEGSAAASAHSQIGQQLLTQTPGPGSLSVTVGAAASDSVPNGSPPPASFELEAIFDAIGTARYGALSGSAHAEASSLPASPLLAGGEVSMVLGFADGALVASNSLAAGTPVTLTFRMTLEASAIHFTDPSVLDPDDVGAAARLEVEVRDAESVVNPPVTGALVINSRGTVETEETLQLATAIGHRIDLQADLFVGAGATIDFSSQGFSQASADVVAGQTGELFFEPEGDVRLESDSGHEYAAPEPGRALLLAASAPFLLWARRRGRR